MKTDYKWLEKWANDLKGKSILELGCGEGADTAVIATYADTVIACDLEPPENTPSVMELDHSKKLPFEAKVFSVVVASLCLHYFSWAITCGIASEISRVLSSNGLLICRLNSTNDSNYGANGYPEIENNLYSVKGKTKRFFTDYDIQSLFPEPWKLLDLEEKHIDRYAKDKIVWEFGAINA